MYFAFSQKDTNLQDQKVLLFKADLEETWLDFPEIYPSVLILFESVLFFKYSNTEVPLVFLLETVSNFVESSA